MTRWRLLETGSRRGAWNMACDEALLAVADAGESLPTLRLFGWDPPAVSIGYNQPAPSAAEIALLATRGVEWVRRPSGGRAVYHGGPALELTYSVVASRAAEGLGGGLRDAYRRIHAAIAEGLVRLGAAADLAPRRSSREGSHRAVRPGSRRACFAAAVPWEIEVSGRKLVGSAQRRSRAALLQHGSIPLAGDQSLLNEIWPGSIEPGMTTTVSSSAGRPVEFEELAVALADAFAKSFRADLEPDGLSARELAALAARLPEAARA